MRILTIQRRKSFVGCALKARVYVRDELAPDTYINQCPYRKLGVIKNGETQTFSIPEGETEILVVSDPMMKGVYNDVVRFDAGVEPIVLSGACVMGVGFVFDGVNDSQRAEYLKKKKKKGIAVLIASCIVGVLIGVLVGKSIGSLVGSSITDSPAAPRTFAVEEMRISLTDDFNKMDVEGFSACYESPQVAVFILREDFSTFEGARDYTLEEYGNALLAANGLTEETLTVTENMVEFQYTRSVDNVTYRFLSFAYKSENAFWLVQFGVEEENAGKMYEQCYAWAQMVSFVETI